MKIRKYQYNVDKVCGKCVMDDTVEGIKFDENGECTFCKIHDDLESKFPLNEDTPKKLQTLANKIKKMEKVKSTTVLSE